GLVPHELEASLSQSLRLMRRRIDSRLAKEPLRLLEGVAGGRNSESAIFEHLVHAHEVVGLVERIGDDSDVEGAQIGEQRLALEIAGEQNEIFNLERGNERAHRFERRAGADDHDAKVPKSNDLDQMSDRAHQMVDAVLLIDDADVAEDELAPAVQPGLRLDAMDALAVGHPVDDLDLRRRFSAAADRDVLEGRVGGDDAVGRPVAHALEKQERAVEKPLPAEFDNEQFRRDVVLIVNEPLADELERQGGEKDEVRRIAGLDDRKAALAVNPEQKAEFVEQRG